jgi:hypothetical protein
MQMRADVRKVVDPNAEPAGHVTKRLAHGTLMIPQGPRAFGPAARKHNVHGPAGANRPLELPTAAPNIATMLGARELSPDVATEE